jgi:hypothetical protein
MQSTTTQNELPPLTHPLAIGTGIPPLPPVKLDASLLRS